MEEEGSEDLPMEGEGIYSLRDNGHVERKVRICLIMIFAFRCWVQFEKPSMNWSYPNEMIHRGNCDKKLLHLNVVSFLLIIASRSSVGVPFF